MGPAIIALIVILLCFVVFGGLAFNNAKNYTDTYNAYNATSSGGSIIKNIIKKYKKSNK